MTALPATFSGRADQKGYSFKLLKRQGMAALFEKTHKGGKQYWEVVILKARPQMTWPDGRVTEAHETMPSSSEWGMCGWTMDTLSRGLRKYWDVMEANP